MKNTRILYALQSAELKLVATVSTCVLVVICSVGIFAWFRMSKNPSKIEYSRERVEYQEVDTEESL